MITYKELKHEYTIAEKQMYWNIGTGLQAVDGLEVSPYLKDLKDKEIQGQMTLTEVEESLKKYYKLEESYFHEDCWEADLVSTRITEYLREAQFRLHPLSLKQIHKSLFAEMEGFESGQYRTINIAKPEAILYGFSVKYEDHRNIVDYLEYDIDGELKKNQKTTEKTVKDIADFVSGLWQIHPFYEGNTRTIAVFTIQYLNSLGYDINNVPFEKHAKYFRDALVRASYNNFEYGIRPNTVFLEQFFENVLLNKDHRLKSEHLALPILQKGEQPKVKQSHGASHNQTNEMKK